MINSRLYPITPNNVATIEELTVLFKHYAELEVGLLQLRLSHLSFDEYNEIAKAVVPIAHQYKMKILLNSYISLVSEVNADGVHLQSSQLNVLQQKPLKDKYLVSASCHNLAELYLAERCQLDFVTLSPVNITTSHPDRPPIGWEHFTMLSKMTTLKVFALGGVKLEDLPFAIECGAYGISAISAFLRKPR